jgi:NitT/TauT family transport system substrate-binding protein
MNLVWRAVLGGLFALLMAGCSDTRVSADDLAVVRINMRPYLSNAPLLIADAERYFEAEGIRLEMVEIVQNTAQSLPSLARGQVDVIAGALSIGLINAIARGASLKVVADKGHLGAGPDGCSWSALVARQSLPLDEAVPAPGVQVRRRIAVNRGGYDAFFVGRVLERSGHQLEAMDLLDLPPASYIAAMRSGSIDLAAISEPWLSHLTRDGHPIIARAEEEVPGMQAAVLIFGPELLIKRREVGERFIRAYLRGVRRYNEGRTPRNLEILTDRTGFGAELLQQVCWPTIRSDGAIHTASILDFQRWAIERGLLKQPVTAAEVVDASFITSAAASLARSGDE